jgi:hypothetical protein
MSDATADYTCGTCDGRGVIASKLQSRCCPACSGTGAFRCDGSVRVADPGEIAFRAYRVEVCGNWDMDDWAGLSAEKQDAWRRMVKACKVHA